MKKRYTRQLWCFRSMRYLGRALLFVLISLIGWFGIPSAFMDKTHWGGSVKAQETAGQNSSMDIYRNARKNQWDGPRDLMLADVGILRLPLGYSFVPKEYANPLLEAMGNFISPHTLGLVVATYEKDMKWFMVVTYTPSGYVDNSNTQNWNVESLRQRLLNEARKLSTSSNQEIVDVQWIIPPQYNYVRHSVSWLLHTIFHTPQSTIPREQGINYKNILFGRKGYINVNLATSREHLEIGKLNAETIVNAIRFKLGERFIDFDPQQDQMADFDIHTLIAGPQVFPDVEEKTPKSEVSRTLPERLSTHNSTSQTPSLVQASPKSISNTPSNTPSSGNSIKTFLSSFGSAYENILLGFLFFVALVVLLDSLRRKRNK